MSMDKAYEQRAQAKQRENQAKIEYVKARAQIAWVDLKIALYRGTERLWRSIASLLGRERTRGAARAVADAWADLRLALGALLMSIGGRKPDRRRAGREEDG